MKWNTDWADKVGSCEMRQTMVGHGIARGQSYKRKKRLIRFKINELKYKIQDLHWEHWKVKRKYKDLLLLFNFFRKNKPDPLPKDLGRGIMVIQDQIESLQKIIIENKKKLTELQRSLLFLTTYLKKLDGRVKK